MRSAQTLGWGVSDLVAGFINKQTIATILSEILVIITTVFPDVVSGRTVHMEDRLYLPEGYPTGTNYQLDAPSTMKKCLQLVTG